MPRTGKLKGRLQARLRKSWRARWEEETDVFHNLREAPEGSGTSSVAGGGLEHGPIIVRAGVFGMMQGCNAHEAGGKFLGLGKILVALQAHCDTNLGFSVG